MDADYTRCQRKAEWPSRGRWNPAGLPDWYVDLVARLAGNLTAWRDHDPGQYLDPRTDPRHEQWKEPHHAKR